MATQRISSKKLQDLAVEYTVKIAPKVESPVIFEFTNWVKKVLNNK